MSTHNFEEFSEFDRALVAALQEGLPLVSEPYAQIASQLGVSEELVLERVASMKENGAIRRIAAVPNHRAWACVQMECPSGISLMKMLSVLAKLWARLTSFPTVISAPDGCPHGLTMCSPWCTEKLAKSA